MFQSAKRKREAKPSEAVDPYRELDPEDVQVIREQLAEGVSPATIAADLQIAVMRIRGYAARLTKQDMDPDLNKDQLIARAHDYAARRARAEGYKSLSLKDCKVLWRRQRGRCKLTNVEFTNHRANPNGRVLRWPWRPSLDRKDNKIGYILGNVRLVAQCVNFARGEWPDKIFYEMCEAAATFNNPKTAARKRSAAKAAITRNGRKST